MWDVLNKMLCISLEHIMVKFKSSRHKLTVNLYLYHYYKQWVSWSNSLYKVIFAVSYGLSHFLLPAIYIYIYIYNFFLIWRHLNCISEFSIVSKFHHNTSGFLCLSHLKIHSLSLFSLYVSLYLPAIIPWYILESSRKHPTLQQF